MKNFDYQDKVSKILKHGRAIAHGDLPPVEDEKNVEYVMVGNFINLLRPLPRH